MTETIEWIACADRLPDDDETVLTYTPDMDGEEVLAGYLQGSRWHDWDGNALLDPVTHWAAWPGGPEA